jgi:hypothetical protein
MRKEYHKNKKITIHGTVKVISEAEAILDTLSGLEADIFGYRLANEGAIRLIIQDAIDAYDIKAAILVDGNTVYPYIKTIKQYNQLEKSGRLDKLSVYMYDFLHQNFDIAYYDRNGYIAHYNNSFIKMKKAALEKATTPSWYTDVQRVLDYIQGRNTGEIA